MRNLMPLGINMSMIERTGAIIILGKLLAKTNINTIERITNLPEYRE